MQLNMYRNLGVTFCQRNWTNAENAVERAIKARGAVCNTNGLVLNDKTIAKVDLVGVYGRIQFPA